MGLKDWLARFGGKGGGASASDDKAPKEQAARPNLGNKALKKQAARLVNPNVQHEDRLRAADILVDMGTEDAYLALLARYDMVLEKGYMDQDEKVYVRDLLVERGEETIGAIKRFMKESINVNWPQRILSNILEDDEKVLGHVLEVLEAERDGGDMKGEKRARLLQLLIQYQDARIIPAVLPFLDDFSEEVRFKAVEVLDMQEDPSVCAPLVKALIRPEEDSVRVRHRMLEILARHRWPLGEYRDAVEAILPDEFILEGEIVVRT